MVDDFCLFNKVTVPIHPLVADPHTILSKIPEDTNWFSVLDFKDVFFFPIPFHPDSQFLFASERENFISKEKHQYT